MRSIPHLGTRIWSLLDQVCFSAANFILVVCFARYYSDIEVSGYGIGLSIALIIQSTQRNCYVVQNAVLAPVIFRRRARAVLGQHMVAWGWILAAELLVFAVLLLVIPGDYAHAIIFSTFVCSLIYAQLDFDRIALAKHDRILDAFYASLVFLALSGALFFLIPLWDIGFNVTMALVGGYALLKIARLVMIVGRPEFSIGRRLAGRAFRKYLASAVLGVVGYSGHSHGPLFILGSVAAPLHSAAFVAMRGLMQPLMVIIRSLDIIDKSLMQAQGDKVPAGLRHAMLRQLAAYAVLCLCAIAASALLGDYVISLVYQDRYSGFDQLLTGWAVMFSLMAITFPIETVIVKLGRLVLVIRRRLLAGAAGRGLAVWRCPLMGARGAIWACIGGTAVGVLCAAWIVRDVIFLRPLPVPMQ
ncbi:MAG: hypothetical protein AB7F82_08855 [Alphaproteobacteria bacterium]